MTQKEALAGAVNRLLGVLEGISAAMAVGDGTRDMAKRIDAIRDDVVTAIAMAGADEATANEATADETR